MSEIIIKKPYIYEWEDKARLAAVIVTGNEEKELYFEVDRKYKEYLCYENSDAFVFALIYFAMANGDSICCKGPMSEQLYYQLTTYFIPVVSEADNLLQPITIKTEIEGGGWMKT